MNLSILLSTISLRRLSTFLFTLSVLILSSGCSVFGGETVEEAPYQVVQKEDPFEIRQYDSLIVAETLVNASYREAGSEAFGKLFAYISGENQGGEKISMTSPVIADATKSSSGEKIAMSAPVTSQKEGDSWRYRFVLPRSFSLETAPRALNPDVTLVEIPAKRVATIRYSGRATEKARAENTEALLDWIESQGLIRKSEPQWAGYNPPWTLPPFRRNEVLIDISSE